MPKLISPRSRTSNRTSTASPAPSGRPSEPLFALTAPDTAADRLTELDDARSRSLMPPQPTRIIPYTDIARIWLRNPMSDADLTRVGKYRKADRKPRFRRKNDPDSDFSQRLTLRQPSRGTLTPLAKRNDVMLNYAEPAIDWIYENADDLVDRI